MTKEVEVGDEFTGKVVKTTTFGAFVELVQGHRRPAAHLERQARRAGRHGRGRAQPRRRDRRARGRGRQERGRIGLRLADDPEIAGKTAEELAVGRHRRQGRRPWRRRPRRPRRRPWRPRRPRRRDGDRGGDGGNRRLPPRPPVVRWPTSHTADRARLGRPGRHRARCPRSARSRSASGSAPARATRRREQAGISHFLEHLLFKGTDRFSSLEIDQIFDGDGGGGQRGHRQGDDLGLLALPRPAPRARVRRDGRTWCCARPTRTSTPSARS